MALRLTASAAPSLHARVRVGALFSMTDSDFAAQLHRIETDPLFKQLIDLGIIKTARFRRPSPPSSLVGVLTTSYDAADPLSSNKHMRDLIHRIGETRFHRGFLSDEPLNDDQRARICGISVSEATSIRKMIDQMYMQLNFDVAPEHDTSQVKENVIGGIKIEQGAPVIAFYQREIWQMRYSIDGARADGIRDLLSEEECQRARHILNALRFLNRRTETLYSILQTLLVIQREYFITEDERCLIPISYRGLARRLCVDHGAIIRLVADKLLRLTSNRQIPLRRLFRSRRDFIADRIEQLANSSPDLRTSEVNTTLNVFGITLTPRTIRRYKSSIQTRFAAADWKKLNL